MIYFSSDGHFFHQNVIRFDNRPFTNVDEMNEMLIQNWNGVVRHDDEIYYLGDFSFGNENETGRVLSRLNGRKFLILGNHDKPKLMNVFKKHFEMIEQYKTLNYKDLYFVMFHFPIEEWHWQHKGAIHLCGHRHNTHLDNVNEKYKRYDVGVRANNYTPVSIDYIIKFVKDKEIKGHH